MKCFCSPLAFSTEVRNASDPALFMQCAPHPPQLLMSDSWTKPYTREYAAFPAAWLRGAKFWPTTCTSYSTAPQNLLTASHFVEKLILVASFWQVVWTMCTGIATSSAPCSRRRKWRKKLQLLLHNLVMVTIPVPVCKTASITLVLPVGGWREASSLFSSFRMYSWWQLLVLQLPPCNALPQCFSISV
jgi:hypothetical protein